MLWNFIEIALRHGCFPINLLHIFRTLFLRWLLGLRKLRSSKKCWNFANRTYFASCIVKEHCFLLCTKETALSPHFYHEIIFYSAKLFDWAVNFKFYLNIFIFLKGFRVPRPSALGPQPPKYCKNKFMNKAYYLCKIKTLYLFKIFTKLFRKAKLWCPK